jgi:hypothetical protein
MVEEPERSLGAVFTSHDSKTKIENETVNPKLTVTEPAVEHCVPEARRYSILEDLRLSSKLKG